MSKEFIGRLNRAFDYGSMADVSRRLGIPHATVRNYYQGRLPASDVLIKIANETNVSLNWLLIGTGEMYVGDAPKIGLGRFIEDRIAELVDERIAAHGLLTQAGGEKIGIDNDVFDVETALANFGDPQSVMSEWFRFEGREYPSDYGVVFFKGWEGFSHDERIIAIHDAKRVLDRTLAKG